MHALFRNVFGVGFALLIPFFYLSACGSSSISGITGVSVVATENFYGDVVEQLGGRYVNVTSILSDPGVDPHEYESSPKDAEAVSRAQLVIENGDGYDDWMDKLLSGSPSSSRVLLQGYSLAPHKLPDNEHVWYDINDMQAIASTVTATLKKLDPAHASTFEQNYQTFTQSLSQVTVKISSIKKLYAGTPVGLTESIYLYQANPLGLNVLTPFSFQKAMAEGDDPPASTVLLAENQIKQRLIKVLIYNRQTISAVTDRLQQDAQAQHIPVVPVTETMPAHVHYQTWQLDQLNALQAALSTTA